MAVGSCSQASGLDEFLDPRSKLVAADLVGIDIELAEDNLDDALLHSSVAALVEVLGVGQQFEGMLEELPAGVQGAGGVSKLGLNLAAFGSDVSKLLLELGLWPSRITDQLKPVVFLGVELGEPGGEPCA